MLHTVNKSPFNRRAFDSCIAHLKEGQGLLLIENGVYAAIKDTMFQSKLEEAMKTVKVYALQPDLEARGLQNRVIDGVTLVDYDGFVDLAVEYPAVQAWL